LFFGAILWSGCVMENRWFFVAVRILCSMCPCWMFVSAAAAARCSCSVSTVLVPYSTFSYTQRTPAVTRQPAGVTYRTIYYTSSNDGVGNRAIRIKCTTIHRIHLLTKTIDLGPRVRLNISVCLYFCIFVCVFYGGGRSPLRCMREDVVSYVSY
jgi:hypothetical protein